MIKLSNPSMSYPVEQCRLIVLNEASLEVGTGKGIAIIGPSGADKPPADLLAVEPSGFRQHLGREHQFSRALC